VVRLTLERSASDLLQKQDHIIRRFPKYENSTLTEDRAMRKIAAFVLQPLFLLVIGRVIAFCHDTYADSSNLLIQVETIPLDGVKGRIDHLGLDARGKRLFVAALGNDTVEVVDLAAGKVTKHIRNLGRPQGIGFAPESNRLAVANDKDGSCRLYDGTTLQQVATIELKHDADNIRYDAVSGRFWVGYGDGGLAAIDPESGKQVADVKLDAHPESFQLETKGKRIFVNVPNAGYVAVVDRETGTASRSFL
jgi:hypothetical protein